jgi:hypothetical protein
MPYRNEVRPVNLFGDYMAGRQAAYGEQEARQGNALRGLQIDRARSVNALAGNPAATPEQYIRAGDAATGGALANVQHQQQMDKREALSQLANLAQKALTIQDPAQRKGFLAQAQQMYGPAFTALGADLSQFPQMLAMPDEALAQKLQEVARFATPVAPAPIQAFAPGSDLYQGGQKIGSVAPKPEKPAGSFRALTPQEIAASGLPAGTSAQVDTATGKIDVLSKRDNTGVLSQKDATTAKMKLNTVALARQQLNRIREAFESGRKGVNAFGPGQGLLPTQQGKIFDARVDQMRSTLTALTRVPGVGAMSDYETKLDQSKFPKRSAYESVTADTLNNLDDQLALIETGYKDLLTGGGSAQAPATPAAQAQPGQPVRVNSPQEAMALPSGTQFVTPDGRVKVRP